MIANLAGGTVGGIVCYWGKALIETESPLKIRYINSEGEFQSRVVEKTQEKKYKRGTIVDIVIENDEVIVVEKSSRIKG